MRCKAAHKILEKAGTSGEENGLAAHSAISVSSRLFCEPRQEATNFLEAPGLFSHHQGELKNVRGGMKLTGETGSLAHSSPVPGSWELESLDFGASFMH